MNLNITVYDSGQLHESKEMMSSLLYQILMKNSIGLNRSSWSARLGSG